MTRSKNVLFFRADNFICDRATGEQSLTMMLESNCAFDLEH